MVHQNLAAPHYQQFFALLLLQLQTATAIITSQPCNWILIKGFLGSRSGFHCDQKSIAKFYDFVRRLNFGLPFSEYGWAITTDI